MQMPMIKSDKQQKKIDEKCQKKKKKIIIC